MKEREMEKVRISFADGSVREVYKDMSLFELAKEYENDFKYSIVAAKVNNDIKELGFKLSEDCRVQFLDLTDEDGMRIYRRSLHFILVKAVRDVFPERTVVISHSISKGVYCELRGEEPVTAGDLKRIEKRMREIVNERIPFVKKMMSTEEAKDIYKKNGRLDKFHAIEYRTKPYVSVYRCGDYEDYFYGYMVPDTGYITRFSLMEYPPGFIMSYPTKYDPLVIPPFGEQKKLFEVFREYKRWGHILGIDNVGELNDTVKTCGVSDLLRISEALHEKKIAQIADMITDTRHNKKLVLISGPSSSGKTTFANRLAIQLKVNGKKPVTISLDDYFVDREKTPIDENGEFDFEALDAIDVKLFNQQLSELINGREVEVPIFNFPKGCRECCGRKLMLAEDQILIIEGIHGLNEKLTASIPAESKFKIYVSALTSMNIDDHNRIPSTDTRIIRRIVRDYQFRGSNAANTIKRWPSVRRGEDRNIFPYQEEADIMFNSSLMYELGVLKVYAEPLLNEVDGLHAEYSEAKRLIEFLSYFLPIDSKEIPSNSIIREFIGGSCF